MDAKIYITKTSVQISKGKAKHLKWLAVMGKMIQDRIEPGDTATLVIKNGTINKPQETQAEANRDWELDCNNQAVS